MHPFQKLSAYQKQVLLLFQKDVTQHLRLIEIEKAISIRISRQGIYASINGLIKRGILRKVNEDYTRYALSVEWREFIIKEFTPEYQPQIQERKTFICARCAKVTRGRYARYGDDRLCKRCNRTHTFHPDGIVVAR